MKDNSIAKRLLSKADKEIIKNLINHNGYIAGGAVLSAFVKSKINDYDLYFHTEHDIHQFVKSINAKDVFLEWANYDKRKKLRTTALKTILLIDKTHNAYTYLYKEQIYQVILAFTGTPDEVFRYFDFSVCMGAYVPKLNEFVVNDQFLVDIVSKSMHFNIGTEYPIASMLRLLKYQKKGYSVSGIEIIKMALAINNLKIQTYSDLKKQLQGIDTQFLSELTSAFDQGVYKEKEFQFNEFLNMLEEYVDHVNSKVFNSDDNEDM